MEEKKSSGRKLKTSQLILLFSIPAVLLLVFLFFAIFGERIIVSTDCGNRMKKLDRTEITRVIVADPLFDTGIPTGSGYEFSLDDPTWTEQWKLNCQELFSGAKYKGRRQAEAGFWDPHVRFILDGEEVRIYLGETYFYFTKGDNALLFEPADPKKMESIKTVLKNCLTEAFYREKEGT
ncbi:MAG: hypothetical protein IJT60_06530 [Clostridia bacterium]|nr:hypothetical protein [Clostridia bacterium]